VARAASLVGELLELLWSRVPTHPVSSSQLPVLFILERNDGINLRTLAEALDSTPSSVSRLCDRLQALGFIERAPATTSRRELRLHLNGRSRTFLADLRARRESELHNVLHRMPPGKRSAFLEGLDAFLDSADSALIVVASPRPHQDIPAAQAR